MIGFLRFIGVANAAIWFGAIVFYTVAAAPALESSDVQELLGRNNFLIYGRAIGGILLTRYSYFSLICATVALLHIFAEWLYQGRSLNRAATWLILVLLLVGLIGSCWLGPQLQEMQRAQYHTTNTLAQREAARRSYRILFGIFEFLNLSLIVGTAIHLRSAANPPDDLRFVGTPKFRG